MADTLSLMQPNKVLPPAHCGSVKSQLYCLPSWDNLLPDLLIMIADCLDVKSVIRLSAVCTSWSSTIRTRYPPLPPLKTDQPVPWLLLSARNSKTKPDLITNLTFYDLGTATSYSVSIPIPSLCDHRWLGSYKGWLVTADKQSQLHLIKPLNGTHTMLPPINNIGQPKKAVLCCTSDCAINELHVFCLTDQGSMLVTKVGDAIWTKCSSHIRDILSFQGKVYALSCCSVCCYDPRNRITMPETVINFKCSLDWTLYLLEWKGQLIMAMIENLHSVRLKNHTPRKVRQFKFSFHSIMGRITNLKDDALFLGKNCSYSVSTVGRNGIEANCIYFTDQVASPFDDHGKHKFGVFNLRNDTYTPCSPQGTPTHSPLPIWFWPC